MSPFAEHLPLILFIYGLAFFAMGLAIVLEARPGSKLPLARNLWPLAAFGFLHAGVEWLDMMTVGGFQEGPLPAGLSVPMARMILLVASSLALVGFGAALLAGEEGRKQYLLAVPPLLFVAWVGAALVGQAQGTGRGVDPWTWASIWTRYILYFPASVLSGLALARQAPALRALGMPHIAADCRRAALVFGVNAFVAGLVVPRADFFPASLLNYATFREALGLPPQLFRGLCAVAITYFVVRVLRMFDLQIRLERERLANQAVLAQEEERKRIARELHDETAQLLSSLLVRLALLDQAGSLEEVRKRCGELMSLAGRAVEGVRRLAVELRPPELDDLGLVEALRWYVEDFAGRWEVDARFRAEGSLRRLAPVAEMALYRIAQEALANVARHSAATRVKVAMDYRDGAAALSVEDDGRGFDVAAAMAARDRGIGLFGMQERATLVGGELRIDSEPGHGTRVSVEIPLPQEVSR